MLSSNNSRWFAGKQSVKGLFLFDLASVHEIDYPYRKCKRALFIHIFPRWSIYFGRWNIGTTNIDEHLLEALKGRIYVQENEEVVITS